MVTMPTTDITARVSASPLSRCQTFPLFLRSIVFLPRVIRGFQSTYHLSFSFVSSDFPVQNGPPFYTNDEWEYDSTLNPAGTAGSLRGSTSEMIEG